jgi:anthranilate phosphoribosyltransferase
VVGCSDVRMLPLLAEVLARRGVRAMLFRGEDGLDELTTTGISTVYDVQDGDVRQTHLDPATLGLQRATLADLAGGDVERNMGIARAVLNGTPGAARDVVLLNAGAALQVAGKADTLEAAMSLAAQSIDSGAANDLLDRWVAVSNA